MPIRLISGLIIVFLTMTACNEKKPVKPAPSPLAVTQAKRAQLVKEMSKTLSREVIELDEVEDKWAFQLNQYCKGKACLVYVDVEEIEQTKEGYTIFGTRDIDSFRTWKVRLKAHKSIVTNLSDRDNASNIMLIIDNVEFKVIDSLVSAETNSVSIPITASLKEKTMLMVTGQVLAIRKEEDAPFAIAEEK